MSRWKEERTQVTWTGCLHYPVPQIKGASFLPSAVVVFWEILSEVWHGGGESACPGTRGSLTLSVSNLDLNEVTQIRTVSSASHPETTCRRIDHNRNSLTSVLRVPVTVLLSPTSDECSFPYVEVPLSLFLCFPLTLAS